MSISKAQQKAVKKYNSKTYEEIKVRVYKGDKDKIKTHAEQQNESVNGFIKRAINETIIRDNSEKTVKEKSP